MTPTAVPTSGGEAARLERIPAGGEREMSTAVIHVSCLQNRGRHIVPAAMRQPAATDAVTVRQP